MKKIILTLLVLVAASTNAQNGVTNNFRFGPTPEDSTLCIRHSSNLNTNLKNSIGKNVSEAQAKEGLAIAFEAWSVLMKDYPVARVDTYTNGIKLLTEMIKRESDPAKKSEYINLLMGTYDQQIKYIDKLQEITETKLSAGKILGKKALDYIKYHKNAPVDSVYSMLAKSVEIEKGDSEYTVTQNFMKYSVQKYKQDKSHSSQLVEDYLNAQEYIVEVIDRYYDDINRCRKKYEAEGDPKDSINAMKYEKMIDASRIVKGNIDAYFINSGAASCEDLSNIYGAKLEENKTNLEYLNKVISVMSMLKCTNEEVYLNAAEYAHQIEPTAKAAMGCGYRYYKKGEIAKALEYFDQAIELETSVTKKAELCNLVGYIYLDRKNFESARRYANKALSFNSKYGDPHILIAQCYHMGPKWSSDDFENACTYYVCLDRLDRAKKVDPSVKREADRYAEVYKKNVPPVDELFMRGYQKGKAIQVGGWINESTKIR